MVVVARGSISAASVAASGSPADARLRNQAGRDPSAVGFFMLRASRFGAGWAEHLGATKGTDRTGAMPRTASLYDFFMRIGRFLMSC